MRKWSLEATMTAFLIPYYNHPKTIAPLVELLGAYNLDIIIVDDGSNVESKQALQAIYAHNNPKIHIITREQNGGKGAAIKEGIIFAERIGMQYVLQLDADMQHDLAKIPEFLKQSKANPNALICAKPQYGTDAPKSRLYGRKITDFWVWVNTLGGNLCDVMCGMRIYPIEQVLPLLKQCASNRMDFDPEILILAYKAHLEFVWIDVSVKYDSNGISHFKAFKDNLLISKMHAKHFFLLPKYLWERCGFQRNKNWWQRKERAGVFFLNLTLLLVIILPNFLLDFCIFVVTLFYFLFSKEERRNLGTFYDHLQSFLGQEKLPFFKKQRAVYRNFYYFGWAICDKIAVWKGKITYKDLVVPHRELMDKELRSKQRGHILLVSHYGNIEVARAMSNAFDKLDITILVYQENALNFLNLINKVSQNKLRVICVNTLDIQSILELEKILENGGHIGIMGDRIAIDSTKNARFSFLGQECFFPQGAFLIAGLLKSKISILWCEKMGEKYQVELERIFVEGKDSNVVLGRDKQESVRALIQQYVESLEKRVCANPQYWFNFYDFWGQNVKEKI